ncbi:TetR family transcriptional regulator [Chitinimonas arctica]|uniref:TetR family transcriptional regulator n=1 Tax=Chitinimonas arctica TaxID=2594795 RepID=A0A516SDF9_9NEIS|nr:TetR family transcriptional regulator [Chitinimonas arctica]QDQ26170.1 TetR family transcriptional regulator [Chitinimonas arctica]
MQTVSKPIRAEKKQQTRQALLDAALELMASGRGFSAISLREVTRQVGIVPAAFYRHFPDMDSLGLALVEQVSSTFREVIRLVRRNEIERQGAITASVRIFVEYAEAHRLLFLFLAREQFGGSAAVRQAVATVQQHFIADLQADLALSSKLTHLGPADLEILASLIVKTVFSTLPELINPSDDQPTASPGTVSQMEDKLRFILIGGKHWRGIAAGRIADE